jgi:hypothetical protein
LGVKDRARVGEVIIHEMIADKVFFVLIESPPAAAQPFAIPLMIDLQSFAFLAHDIDKQQ